MVIIAWIVVVLLSLILIPSFFSSVSYDIMGSVGSPPNSESETVSNILQTQFPEFNNKSENTIIIVVQGTQVYSDSLKDNVLKLNSTLSKDKAVINYTGESSLYSMEASLLNESLPEIIDQTANLQSNITTINSGLYTLQDNLAVLSESLYTLQDNLIVLSQSLYTLEDNLATLSTSLFQMQDGINQTSQLVYGIPAIFVGTWQAYNTSGATFDTSNAMANATVYQFTSNFGGNTQSLQYYNAFYGYWLYSFQPQVLSSSASAFDHETFAINQTVTAMLTSGQLDSDTSMIMNVTTLGLNVANWNDPNVIGNLTISTMATSIPSSLSSSLGVTPTALLETLYSFGASPSSSTLGNYAINLMEPTVAENFPSDLDITATALLKAIYNFGRSPSSSTLGNYAIELIVTNNSNQTFSDVGFSVSDLIQASYNLGRSPSNSQTWNLSCDFISNSTKNAFSDSPLFTVNSTSLSILLRSLTENATTSDISNGVDNEISTQSYANYPFVLLTSLTKNFGNSNNDTMLIFLSFSSIPDADSIAQVKSDVQDSGLQNFGEVYVTGVSVLSNDFQITFMPALEITLLPGIAVSILIVGLLFLAPLAALIPILVGGCSIVVSLAAIYLGIVDLGHGSLTFLTPVLTILLMLGLAVDYTVLQLKRTKEERLKGKSIEESVGISIKWAGQAVLTAGLTVIVAYIIMAVVNVPIFSQVGTAIALGVVILLAASLTLLPALEIALGDKIFWPGLNRHSKTSSNQKNILKRVADGTLKKKVPIVIILSVLSIGALFVTSNTPFSSDFQKLIPNFSSNQGVTVISDNFGSGTLYPTYITITTPTEITYGDKQYNQTLLNQIDQITATAASADGVISVASPTRPYGGSFNYSNIECMSESLRLQYENAMLTMIGEDNKTVLITVGLSDPALSQLALNSLSGMEKNINSLSLMNGIVIHFGGQTQSTRDSQSFMDILLPEVTIILAVAVYVILFFQLRSAFTPLRLIITVLCSVVMSLAIVSLIFYSGLALPVFNYAPLFAVVTLLGVGIDYDIFFVTRIREEVLNGKTDDEAIKGAVEKVWVTIFSLGLVLAVVFGSLFLTGIVLIQELSLAIAGAVLIDVTVVILFFVPALMGMAEKLNWWPYKLSIRKQPENNTEQKENSQ